VTAISFWINAQHIGHIWTFYEASVEHLLSDIVHFILKNTSADSDGLIVLLSDNPIQHFGEPPNTFISRKIPFL